MRADLNWTVERATSRCIYTLNEVINDILVRYMKSMTQAGVRYSVDASEIPKSQTRLFGEAFELAMEEASERCLSYDGAKERYLRVRCKKAQNRLFVKISCTSRGDAPDMQDRSRINRLEEILNGRIGYFRFVQDEDSEEAILQLSAPCRKASRRAETEQY